MFSVMIVEDEEHILKFMNKKLSAFEDFQVKGTFSTPEEALAAFDNIQPEVVFLDIEMPRINGIELARRLLEKKQDIHIIFTTAYAQYALNAFEVEAIDYLMKPIGNDDLVRVLKRLNKVVARKPVPKAGETGKVAFPVRCFGCFEIRDQQQQVVGWPTRKSEELFAYFLTRQGRYITKWELLDLFWSEVDEERSLQNLYNTIYRIKQVLKKLALPVTIKKVNDGYILESEVVLSDLTQLILLTEKENSNITLHIEDITALYFSYRTPLFGMRDYIWSFSAQEYVAVLFRKLCNRLLCHYREQNQFKQAEGVLRHYVSQHVEDEKLMIKWLELLENWSGYEQNAIEYLGWFNEKLKEAELPELQF